MWLKFLLWLGTKNGKWVLRIFAILIAGVAQYAYTAYAEKRAYNNGYLVGKAEYAEATKTQSMRLTAQLNDTFKKHQELFNQQKADYEKLTQIVEQYRALGNCHTTDGIGMFNEQIRSRSNGKRTEPTTKH